MSFAEFTLMFSAFRDALVTGIIFWLLYMATEPQTRIRLPRMLESWNRVLAGKFRHPLVGQDVLIGLTIGISTVLIAYAIPIPFMERYAPRLLPYSGAYFSLWCWRTVTAVGGALSYMFALNLMIVIFRRQWVAVAAFVLALTPLITWGHVPPFTVALNVALLLLAVACVLVRFGLLCTVAVMYAFDNRILRFLLQQTHLRGTRVRGCSRWPVCLRLLCSRSTQPPQGKPCGRKGSAKASENFDSVCCMCEYLEKSRYR